MSKKTSKKKILENLKPNSYTVYGIFSFKINKLVYVSLDYDSVDMEFEMENYDDTYDIVSFDIILD